MTETVAPGNRKPAKESLADTFEYMRRRSLRAGFPMFAKDFKGHTWLDEADPAELPEAADKILLGQTARLAILAAGRLENAVKSGGFAESSAPVDALVEILMRERDRAADFYLDVKRRLAKIAHLENLNRRAEKKAAANERTIVVVTETAPEPGRKAVRRPAGVDKSGKADRDLAAALAGAGRGGWENPPPLPGLGARRLAAVGGA
ncbi:MAG: hypothetical protein LBU23_13605 [Planctomycetota bacterium]|jgi:hypothetical protein|nr:hypothetical protein [Planctomycetota bacterium]